MSGNAKRPLPPSSKDGEDLWQKRVRIDNTTASTRTITASKPYRPCLHCGSDEHDFTKCVNECSHCNGEHFFRRCPELGVDVYSPQGFLVFATSSATKRAMEKLLPSSTPSEETKTPPSTTADVLAKLDSIRAELDASGVFQPRKDATTTAPTAAVDEPASIKREPGTDGSSPLRDLPGGEPTPSPQKEMTQSPPKAPAATNPTIIKTECEPKTARSTPPSDLPVAEHSASPPQKQPEQTTKRPTMLSRMLRVGNVACTTTKEELKAFFKGFDVVTVSVPLADLRTARAVGYAYVTISPASEAARAVDELMGKSINGRKVSITVVSGPASTPDELTKTFTPSAKGEPARTVTGTKDPRPQRSRTSAFWAGPRKVSTASPLIKPPPRFGLPKSPSIAATGGLAHPVVVPTSDETKARDEIARRQHAITETRKLIEANRQVMAVSPPESHHLSQQAIVMHEKTIATHRVMIALEEQDIKRRTVMPQQSIITQQPTTSKVQPAAQNISQQPTPQPILAQPSAAVTKPAMPTIRRNGQRDHAREQRLWTMVNNTVRNAVEETYVKGKPFNGKDSKVDRLDPALTEIKAMILGEQQ
ncbi:uncharacterized protein LTR77_009833 [Saxophila tyrrhenica]|uniref:RRM domain-containing protein n=1 Tax=Saxophila tyrrhenica TaxID=1690608 RepID=A0AAV9P039_9PEZI|nr:hypothetical protein LTR77_009833 [Saxophila tyrrhenica]